MKEKTCKGCNKQFTSDEKRRKYCLDCIPIGQKHYIDTPEGHRRCSRCSSIKPLEEFTRSSEEPSGYRWYCKKCSSQIVIARQQKQKAKWVEYKGGKCAICGYDKCNGALHFHHVISSKKDFSLSTYKTKNWEDIKKELDKCILLCANCHAEIHAGIISIDK